MQDWFDLIYVGPQQILPIAVMLVLWVLLAGIGYLASGRGRIVEANVFIGWAVVSSVFTLVGILASGSFASLTFAAGIAGVVGVVRAWRSGATLFVPGTWRVVVLSLPLLWIAAAMTPSQWDEFSHWLPAVRFLLETDGFPTAERSFDGFAGYPYAWPILMYLAGRIGGGLLDNIGGQLNVALLLTFAVFVLRMGFAVAGRPRADRIGWGTAAAAALIATAFNPTFVQKIVLTAYSDVASSVATGAAVLIGFVFLARVGGRDRGSAIGAAWLLGLALALLINVRQTNINVFLALLLALSLVAWRDPDIVLPRFARHLIVALVLPLLIYGAWRYYIATHLAGLSAEAGLRPLAAWNWSLIPQIFVGMADVAFKKIAFFAPMMIACAFALRALVRCRTDFDRISLLVAVVFAVNVAFLLVAYLGHFGEGQAVTVVSFWRYNIDIGMVCVVFIVVGVLWAWRRRASFDIYPRWATPAAIVLALILPLAFAAKLRFDLEPPKPYYVRVAQDLAHARGDIRDVHVFDPLGTGEAAVITRYYLDRPGKEWLSSFSAPSPEVVKNYLGRISAGAYVLVHSLSDGVAAGLDAELDPRQSYLFKREEAGWRLIRRWPKPADHPY